MNFSGNTGSNLVAPTSGIIAANVQTITAITHSFSNAQEGQATPLSIRPKQGLVYPRNTEQS